MRVLVYTISDLTEVSAQCVNLLYDSLLYRNTHFDFYIITDDYKFEGVGWLYDVIYVENQGYIGWLKYTNQLPDGYDYYIYLDNDILFYEDLNLILPKDKDYSFVVEPYQMGTVWFRYPFASSQEKWEMNSVKGFNAGTFVFKDKSFLTRVSELFVPQTFKSIEEEGKFEQKCFNYAIFKEKPDYVDISPYIQLHATDITEKSIYHFCGFDGHMGNKLEKMKTFHKKWIETKS